MIIKKIKNYVVFFCFFYICLCMSHYVTVQRKEGFDSSALTAFFKNNIIRDVELIVAGSVAFIF